MNADPVLSQKTLDEIGRVQKRRAYIDDGSKGINLPPEQQTYDPLSTAPCWCCAMWGKYTPGTRQDQGMDPGWLCDRCADSSPSACNTRHEKETAA